MTAEAPVFEEVTTDQKHLLKVLSDRMVGDPYAAIREYVSNAHDASLQQRSPRIHVWGEVRKIHIADNGCGMTRAVILEAFTRIAGRYEGGGGRRIGMFGLGVLSAFMVSDELVVETRSMEEENGWRLTWAKNETRFMLERIDRHEHGTTATFHLAPDYWEMANNEGIREYLEKTFGLLTMPLLVGPDRRIVNVHHQWLVSQARVPGTRLFFSGEAFDLLRRYCHLEIVAAYSSFLDDGRYILLGIPRTEHAPLDLHKVMLFLRGVLVRTSSKAYFPENLAFVVGLVDHPELAVQIDKDGFLENHQFRDIRASMESHILAFLELLASTRPQLMDLVVHTHRTMLLAHGHLNPQIWNILRDHYHFHTSIGDKPWKEMVTFARTATVAGRHHERVLFVLSDQSRHIHALPAAENSGYPLIHAPGIERLLLVALGQSEGVHIADAATLVEGAYILEVPEAFRELGAKLAVALQRRGITVRFGHLQGQGGLPAILSVTSGDIYPEQLQKSGKGACIKLDALVLNVAHPLIEALAAKVDKLTAASLQQSADVLYSIAALGSPVSELKDKVSDITIHFLIAALKAVLGFNREEQADDTMSKCFVALPFSTEFDSLWHAVHSVLSGPPYYWTVVRADEEIRERNVLEGVTQHIASSRRFIADVSGQNANVMLELGMMLQRSPEQTLILTDKETFSRLPADLQGIICLVYPTDLRRNEREMRNWFEKAIRAHKTFTAMQGSN